MRDEVKVETFRLAVRLVVILGDGDVFQRKIDAQNQIEFHNKLRCDVHQKSRSITGICYAVLSKYTANRFGVCSGRWHGCGDPDIPAQHHKNKWSALFGLNKGPSILSRYTQEPPQKS